MTIAGPVGRRSVLTSGVPSRKALRESRPTIYRPGPAYFWRAVCAAAIVACAVAQDPVLVGDQFYKHYALPLALLLVPSDRIAGVLTIIAAGMGTVVVGMLAVGLVLLTILTIRAEPVTIGAGILFPHLGLHGLLALAGWGLVRQWSGWPGRLAGFSIAAALVPVCQTAAGNAIVPPATSPPAVRSAPTEAQESEAQHFEIIVLPDFATALENARSATGAYPPQLPPLAGNRPFGNPLWQLQYVALREPSPRFALWAQRDGLVVAIDESNTIVSNAGPGFIRYTPNPQPRTAIGALRHLRDCLRGKISPPDQRTFADWCVIGTRNPRRGADDWQGTRLADGEARWAGYRFTYERLDDQSFRIHARPARMGRPWRLSMMMDASGSIHATSEDRAARDEDPPPDDSAREH